MYTVIHDEIDINIIYVYVLYKARVRSGKISAIGFKIFFLRICVRMVPIDVFFC